ncbi:TRP-domain-containing protein [Sporormia fimetaria CBS 119925]|uniref:TRP-domain-containing protein n=1 Tax=Sporormia fimetaria CBS 119925 TaxID=1340428 RepID=A0A6A6V5V1_9PLEO|nr:TRP-domain-containing protein [Sporormia fimetaria CBS 119925]
MAPGFGRMVAILVLLLAFLQVARAAETEEQYVRAEINGKTMLVRDNRRPALYTQDFGDCKGDSSINVTRFDAAYYKDNMTVTFHLAGESAMKNESIMMYIGVYAYGQNRFDLTFDPCHANIYSACPVEAGTPIEANGVIPVNAQDVAAIPDIALSIPDFEGEAILRIFANSTQTEIGCFSAVITNGASFSQPAAVGSALGFFTFVAVVASFATAIYGSTVPDIRKHYAHSMSVQVVFAVWHHIFFSGALSVNWPSVLVAFWSNYAWAAGMIYTESMQNTINNFIGSNKGNTSQVGAAGTGVETPELGGGFDIRKIYTRDVLEDQPSQASRMLEKALARRDLAGKEDGYAWYGDAVKPGLPLPGNFSGFAGTLKEQKIPASNAFMTGFIWFVILLAAVVSAILLLKVVLETLSKSKMIRAERLALFRKHWLRYTLFAVLRTLVIGYFMLIFLSLFQFAYLASPAPVAVACIVFLILFLGVGGLAAYACFFRLRSGDYIVEKKRLLKVIPWYGLTRNHTTQHLNGKPYADTIAWPSIHPESSIHDDEEYTSKFGWLASRFRRTRWWFFVAWLLYESIRACFLAGASGAPRVQVFGLLAVEVVAFVVLIILRPFEGQRLNVIVVYLLGFSKVATTGLSAAFDTTFNLPRITTTVIGVVIIVIQGLLTVVVLVAIVSGAITTYFSLTRYRETIRPSKWNGMRDKYYKRLNTAVLDIPRPAPPPRPPQPKDLYFSINSIKRVPKVEDEDAEFMAEINGELADSRITLPQQDGIVETRPTRSRASSMRSQMSFSSLPHRAHVHRASWSSRDFSGDQFRTPDHRRHSRGGSLSVISDSVNRSAFRAFPDTQGSVARGSEPQTPLFVAIPRPMSPPRADFMTTPVSGHTGRSPV